MYQAPLIALLYSRFNLVNIARIPDRRVIRRGELNEMKREDSPRLLRYLGFDCDNKVRYALKFVALARIKAQ